jgi:hypothetical protein
MRVAIVLVSCRLTPAPLSLHALVLGSATLSCDLALFFLQRMAPCCMMRIDCLSATYLLLSCCFVMHDYSSST